MTAAPSQSRAVLRLVEGGNSAYCAGCDVHIAFRSPMHGKREQVICNVYEVGRWQRVEHWHFACYLRAGYPHGHPKEETT